MKYVGLPKDDIENELKHRGIEESMANAFAEVIYLNNKKIGEQIPEDFAKKAINNMKRNGRF